MAPPSSAPFSSPKSPASRPRRRRGTCASSASTARKCASILQEIDGGNADVVFFLEAPAIAVYAPPNKLPWDDAVMLALDYAEHSVPRRCTTGALAGELEKYDWLHLHHEDFTGQYGS